MATFRQKTAFKKVLNGSTIKSAMIDAGYSKTTASATGKLTRTKGWEELMNQHMPDSILAKKHRQMLNKLETIRVYNHDSGEYENIKGDQPHSDVMKALESAYKLKHRYSDEPQQESRKTVVAIQIIVNGSHPETRTDV